MATPDDFKVSDVYNYKTPEDLKRYYDDWAHAYNGYCEEVNYALPRIVANRFVEKFDKDWGWVLDVGCGTGLVGKHLRISIPNIDLHGIDISPEMVKLATSTGAYQWCSVMNVKNRLEIRSGRKYDGLVSAGTFTLGHLDVSDLEALFTLLKPGSLVSISVKVDHYFKTLFAETLIKWSENKLIKQLYITEENGYDSEYEAKNKIISFRLNNYF